MQKNNRNRSNKKEYEVPKWFVKRYEYQEDYNRNMEKIRKEKESEEVKYIEKEGYVVEDPMYKKWDWWKY